jgi:hypothetical protein
LKEKYYALDDHSGITVPELKLNAAVFSEKESREQAQKLLDELEEYLDPTKPSSIDTAIKVNYIQTLGNHIEILTNVNSPIEEKHTALKDIQALSKNVTKKYLPERIALGFAAFAIAAGIALVLATAAAIAAFLITSPTGPGAIFAAFITFVKAIPLTYQLSTCAVAAVIGGGLAVPAGLRFMQGTPEQIKISNAMKEFTKAAVTAGKFAP